jgi:hypothetical protein
MEAELAGCRELLFRRRCRRVAPVTDRKVVADWNGLMISAMVTGGQVLGRDDLVDAAARAAEFIRSSLMDGSGLRHVYAAGKAKIPAFLDDYAFVGRACLDLFEARVRADDLAAAKSCAERLLDEFLDEAGGGFHFTGSRNEDLVVRSCDLRDGAVPAGNSVAAELMLRLWALTGEERYRRAGQGVLDRFLGEALRNPYEASHLLAVADRLARGLQMVVVVGEPAARARLWRAARESCDPGCTVIAIESPQPEWYPRALCQKPGPSEGAWVYVCSGSACGAPLETEEEVREVLRRWDSVKGEALEGAE